MSDDIRQIIQDLTGKSAPFELKSDIGAILRKGAIGYSQMNELLLSLGYGRISPGFYQFLVDGTTRYDPDAAIKSVQSLRAGVDRFMRLAALRFGNIRYAFGYFATLGEGELEAEVTLLARKHKSYYAKRHAPALPIKRIPGEQTFYLGYLIKKSLEERLQQYPKNAQAKKEMAKYQKIVAVGKYNHEAYLASDYMDIYVATSMRERHEYQIVGEVIAEVSSYAKLAPLKLRWFNPTQAYCEDRIDKGLAEGLMLKRATCTLYLAQENDTLGKDSELASTLAQGKPVIAYIPKISSSQEAKHVDHLLRLAKQGRTNTSQREIVMEQLRIFAPNAAWSDKQVMSWVANPGSVDVTAAKRKLGRAIREHYDRRASVLKDTHPLGIQVHLETGVANGVLVARSIRECSELVWRIMMNRLEFTLETKEIQGNRSLLLVEKITGSIFRVVSGDAFLTNVFWNFYLRP